MDSTWQLKELFPELGESLIERVLKEAKRDGLNQDALMEKLLVLHQKQEEEKANWSNEEKEKKLMEDRKNQLELLKGMFSGVDEKLVWNSFKTNQWNFDATIDALLNVQPAEKKQKTEVVDDADDWVIIDTKKETKEEDLFRSVIWNDPTEFVKAQNQQSTREISMEEIPEDLVEDEEEEEGEKEKERRKQSDKEEKESASRKASGEDLFSSQFLSATLFEKQGDSAPTTKDDAPLDAFAAYSLKILAQQLQKTSPQLIKEMHVIPPSITPEKAESIFGEWRQSLWFAPTGFSQLVSRPKIKLAYVPYYCVVPTTSSYFKAKFENNSHPSGWQEFVSAREVTHEQYVAFGSMGWQQVVGELLEKVKDWNMENSTPVLNINNVKGGAENVQEGALKVEVRALADPSQVWKVVEKEIVSKEKEEAQAQLMREYAKQTQMMVKMKDFVLTKVIYKETRYRVVYVPVYIIKYQNDLEHLQAEEGKRKSLQQPLQQQPQSQSKARNYAFVLNAQTGKHDGVRPYGMGKVLGYGMRFLEGILGVKDQESVGFVEGRYLKVLDACSGYEEEAKYLVFPPSHSYILYSDTGYITLKNTSDKAMVLVSQKREANKVGGKYVLQPGTTEKFDFTGSWCIKVECGGEVDAEACLSVVAVSTDGGGGFGNLLGMA